MLHDRFTAKLGWVKHRNYLNFAVLVLLLNLMKYYKLIKINVSNKKDDSNGRGSKQ